MTTYPDLGLNVGRTAITADTRGHGGRDWHYRQLCADRCHTSDRDTGRISTPGTEPQDHCKPTAEVGGARIA